LCFTPSSLQTIVGTRSAKALRHVLETLVREERPLNGALVGTQMKV